ncbi:MAG: RluA family pseudouridine synthase [Oligoflexia bacterium]|nr:RluA family pseudouridine synthase [Oligoflexia bacterium]
MSSKRVTQTVASESAGMRLDVWLASVAEIQTRNQATRLIEKNKVRVSGVLPLKVKASYRLRGGEVIDIDIPETVVSTILPQDIPIEILYQDYDVAVVNKPAGLVTHPAAGHADGTLVNSLLFHIKDLSDIGGVERPGLVHRLDKDTSGVLVVAKGNKAHKHLSDLFKAHDIHRMYLAIVAGVPKEKSKTIESNLARHPVHRKAFSSQENGKHAITHYEVIETYKNQASLIHVKLETGRTHQIRVHLSEMGNPVLGDQIYGVRRQKTLITNNDLKKIMNTLPRHALHAAELAFEHPRTKQYMAFETPWPDDLLQLIEGLKKLK